MKLDIQALGTFYEMAREGAGLAADRFSSMTDIPARVDVTHLNFTRDGTVARDLTGSEWVGIRVTLSDGFSGTSLLLFDEESADTITEAMVEGVPTVEGRSLHESAVTEVGQTMNNGFVDGWANVLDANIDVSAPRFIATDGSGEGPAEQFPVEGISARDSAAEGSPSEPAATNDGGELAVLFRNSLEAVGEELTFRHYLIPDADTVERLFAARSDHRAIEFEKLVGFDRIAQRGATHAADNLAQMSGIEMDVDIRRINFISLDAIPSEVSAEPMIGVAFSFTGMPSGYLLFLFDERSARTLVAESLSREPADDLGAFERDAIQELSNVMASGMLDGWANLLDTTVDHSTPAYAHDMGAAVVDPLVVGLGDAQEFAFVFDTRIEAVGTEVDLDIYVIPDEADLREALGAFDVDRVAETRPEASTELPDEPTDSTLPEALDYDEAELL